MASSSNNQVCNICRILPQTKDSRCFDCQTVCSACRQKVSHFVYVNELHKRCTSCCVDQIYHNHCNICNTQFTNTQDNTLVSNGRCTNCQNACSNCKSKDNKIVYQDSYVKICNICENKCCYNCFNEPKLLHEIITYSNQKIYKCGPCVEICKIYDVKLIKAHGKTAFFNNKSRSYVGRDTNSNENHIKMLYGMFDVTITKLIERLDKIEQQVGIQMNEDEGISKEDVVVKEVVCACGYKKTIEEHLFCGYCGSKY